MSSGRWTKDMPDQVGEPHHRGQVAAVLVGERRQLERGVRHVDALLAGQLPGGPRAADDAQLQPVRVEPPPPRPGTSRRRAAPGRPGGRAAKSAGSVQPTRPGSTSRPATSRSSARPGSSERVSTSRSPSTRVMGSSGSGSPTGQAPGSASDMWNRVSGTTKAFCSASARSSLVLALGDAEGAAEAPGVAEVQPGAGVQPLAASRPGTGARARARVVGSRRGRATPSWARAASLACRGGASR